MNKQFDNAMEQGEMDVQIGVARRLGGVQGVTMLEDLEEQGVVSAIRELADWYMHGTNVAQDGAKAMLLYKKAAEAGDAEAQYQFGYHLARGGWKQRSIKRQKWMK